jgi:hypothetical protein
VSETLSGLEPNTTYNFQLVATVNGVEVDGGDEILTTLPSPPAVITGGATAVDATDATLSGTVNPNGDATTYEIEYGTDMTYGSVLPENGEATLDQTQAVEAVQQGVSGLQPNTTYHYRVVATNPGGTTYGGDMTFTTPQVPPPPASTGTGSTSEPVNAPPPTDLPSSAFGTPTSATASTIAPTILTESFGEATVSVTVPVGALPTGTTVSVYPIVNTMSLVAEIPAGKSYVIAAAVSWQTPSGTSPAASAPITMTITDPSVQSGATLYVLTSTGVEVAGTATADGSVTITFLTDPVFVVAQTALPARPATIALHFGATDGSLSAGAKEALTSLAKRLVAGATVTITGYAKGSARLARSRANAAAKYLFSRVKIHLTLKTVSNTTANKVTVATIEQ